MTLRYDALLVVGFGGPEKPDDVMPFLRNVTRGRDVPDGRLAEVAAQYARFAGASPINRQIEELAHALGESLAELDIEVPVYVGNRNWHPFLADTLTTMEADNVSRAIAMATSAFSSYPGCRQYREDIERALDDTGLTNRMTVDKIPPFWEVSGFLDAIVERVEASLADVPGGDIERTRLVFTAHSIPVAMAETCGYEAQLRTAAAIVANHVDCPYDVVFQSRSGHPQVPWLEPDIVDHLAKFDPAAVAVVVPLGFISDHIEVLFDLDTRAAEVAAAKGIVMHRVPTVGTLPTFVHGLAVDLAARFRGDSRLTTGSYGGQLFPCANDCCPYPSRLSPPRA